MKFLDLNEDCLIHMCRYFDAESIYAISETCTTLKRIAKSSFNLKRSFTFCIDSKQSEGTAAKLIKKFGKLFMKIDLMFELDYHSSYIHLFTLLAESVGPTLNELSILGTICSLPLTILAPIFAQLDVLTLQNVCWEDHCYAVIDLPYLCQNLRKLIISGQIDFTPNLNRSFRRLESLEVDFASNKTPIDVLERNEQLKKLHLWNRRTIKTIDLTVLTNCLVNLEELYLDYRLIVDPINQLHRLANFSNLHTLELYTIPASSFTVILSILETLNQLREIVLQSDLKRLDNQFLSSQESLIRIAMTLTKVESFATVNIDWTSESVVEFVRHALKLNYFQFWSGQHNYVITPQFVRDLATARRLSRVYVDVKGEDCRPLQLKMFGLSDDLKMVFNEPEVATCIKLYK